MTTDAERRLVEAAVTWWRTNRARNLIMEPALLAYYYEPATRALVEAAADVNRERGHD